VKQKEKKILNRAKDILKTIAPDARILLYGSRARGDAQSDTPNLKL
jgi:predicted nucleotidyltransferase